MDAQSLMQETLKTMPKSFTSYQFGVQLRKKEISISNTTSVSDKLLRNGNAKEFLKTHCMPNGKRSRTWQKAPNMATTTTLFDEISIDDAIRVLKNAGYKVLKPETQFKEI